uniref:Uncharacterized protein n=1 Tax=Romanomermis culicivorax TaxID=13658 RepID=A0A915J8V8_ROMCU
MKAPKQNVTNRIGFDCSAFAVVKFEKGGSVEVTACVDHYGHDNLLSRLTSMDVNGPQTSDELDYCEKRKNLRSKFLILSNSVDSLSSDQIDEWESVLARMENSQSQPLSKQSSTAGVVPNKDLQSRRHFSIKKNTDTAKRRLKKYTIENNKSEQ